MVDGGRQTYDDEVVNTHYKRLFKSGRAMFDPPLPPQHEVFQVDRFWEELQRQIKEWEEARATVQRLRAGEDVGLSEKEQDKLLESVHLLGDRIFKFFTIMRAHLDRNPRDRIGFYETRPEGLGDVYGIFMKILSAQIDTDYCPRCHLRLDGTTTVCGDPHIVGPYLYNDNHIFGFEAKETEHSFWTTSWFIEYERRAKDLWYQSIQLPFFRTSAHTAAQCEAMMEIYHSTLNRGEANHFMRQCQVHNLPITPRMVECHRGILEATNPHSIFFHGDPESVSPRWLRYKMELEKLEQMKVEHGVIKHPPASYLPHSDADAMYLALPSSFDVQDNGWVKNFQEVSAQLQACRDDWSPVVSQRSQSAEFPDWAYDEATLARIEFWRTEIRKTELIGMKAEPLKVRGKQIYNSRTRVRGIQQKDDMAPAPELSENTLMFPTAYAYEAFDTSEEAFTAFHQWLGDGDGEYLKHGIKPGTRLKATTLLQYIEPHVPRLTHSFPICESQRDGEVDVNSLPVVDFSIAPRAMLEVLEYGSNSHGRSLEQWRKTGRPWSTMWWEKLEANHRNLRLGAGFYSNQDGKNAGTLHLVGLHDGKLWAARNNERFASVILGSSHDDIKRFVQSTMDAWAVQQHVEVEGVVVGHKDDQIWVQWGPNRVATPLGANMDSIMRNFRNLELLPGKGAPVEPPSWYIPFRNSWKEKELEAALRSPWTAEPFTSAAPYQLPQIKQDLTDPRNYALDDYRTAEYEGRVDVRNLMGGSAKACNERRFSDDVIYSVNPMGNNAMHTGYGQPQVDRDELNMPLGPDDGTEDQVPKWEIEEMEQSLRDISGRAPGAAVPTVDQLSPDSTINDPLLVRRRSQMQMANRSTLITDPANPSGQVLRDLELGQLNARARLDRSESWEFGGLRDVGRMAVLPHEKKTLLGESPLIPLHKQLHLTGAEAGFQKLNATQEQTVATFKAMNEFYDDLNQPFDIGHTTESSSANIDPLLPHNLPSKTMSVGKKRRMAGLLLRLWMKKAEKNAMTLSAFAKKYQLHRLSLLAWFGGDSPATPSVLSALKHWLHDDLKRLDLLDDFKLEAVDSYSPVYEPGFYRWLDKSHFEHQYELLVGAKLRRYDSTNLLGLQDPLSTPSETASGELDLSEQEALRAYEDSLMGGNVNPLNKAELDSYDARTAADLPRVSVNPVTRKVGANVNNFKKAIGFEREFISSDRRFFGALSYNELREAIYSTLRDNFNEAGRERAWVSDERGRAAALEKVGIMDARTAVLFAKDWKEGAAMDLLYAIRRNYNNAQMRNEFKSFVDFSGESKKIAGKLNGLYEHENGAIRITDMMVENATNNGPEWKGQLEKQSDDSFRAELSNNCVLTVCRGDTDTIEWTYAASDSELVPSVAVARRAGLDLDGTMWRLYVEGTWAPGEEEARLLVLNWTRNNTDKVSWELLSGDLKVADAAFIKSALSRLQQVELHAGEPFVYEDKSIRRVLKAEGDLESVDTWVALAPAEATSVVRIDHKAGRFSFECTQVAVDVERIDAPGDRPFEFESFRTEKSSIENKWAALGMPLARESVKVMSRKGTPIYGELLEMMHWLDILFTKMDVELAELDSLPENSPEQKEEKETQIMSYRAIQQECVDQVLKYQQQHFPDCSPVLLGNSGYDGSILSPSGDIELQFDTVTLDGFHAAVLDRQLPLLRWWHGVLEHLKAVRRYEAQRLNKRLASI